MNFGSLALQQAQPDTTIDIRTTMATAKSVRRKQSPDQADAAVLVTGPRIREESNDHSESGAVVEPESYRDVDVSGEQQPAAARGSNPLRRLLESSFLLTPKPSQEEQELEELDAPVQVALHRRDLVENYDTCREYSYEDDDDEHDDSELSRHYFNDTGTASASTAAAGLATASSIYLLGRTYHPLDDYDARRSDESSLFWFTYRCDFPCIEPYGITSDAGWGCMLRALQMMMGQAVRLHYKSRDWRPQQSLAFRRQDPFLRSVLTWFADFPSADQSIYSLHNMVAAGLAKYDKLPGEWYGPGTACYVLRDLVALHEQQQQRRRSVNNPKQQIFRVHVASGGTVYRDAIENVVARRAVAERAMLQQEIADQLAHPLDTAWEEVGDPHAGSGGDLPWDTALLLLIPLRLGLKSFNTDYCEQIAHIFSLPQSVGVLGGRPRGARWFYGAVSDGSKIFGLDPHIVQAAPRTRTARVNGQPTSVVEFSDEYMQSVHTTYTEVFSLARMDPSIGLGFYCRDRTDLENLFSSLQKWKEEHPSAPDLFTVADKSPDYEAKQDSAMENLFESMLDEKNSKDSGENDEEDEFVVL